MRKSVVSLIVVLFAMLLPIRSYTRTVVDREDVKRILKRLDRELDIRDAYIEKRHFTIDSLKKVISGIGIDNEKRLNCILRLGDSYNAFNTDSAITFYEKGRKLSSSLGYDSICMRFELRIATYLPLLSFTTEAKSRLEKVAMQKIPEGLLPEYYDAARQMYSYIALYYSDYPDIHDAYVEKSHAAQTELLKYLDSSSSKYLLNQGEDLVYHQQYSKAKAILLLLLDRLPEEDNLFARAGHLLADISKAQGEHNAHIYYLALSAIADTRGATLEVSSLQELGRIMYLNGDVEHAYDYLSTALSEAVECNAPLRIIQSSSIFPIIETAHKSELRRSEVRTYVVIFILVFLLIVLVATLYVLHRKNRQMNRMAVNLAEANNTKDIYISQFLSLCSIYMDKLNQFNKMVHRKITTGKVDDLLKLTKQGKFIEEQSKEFYDVFDDAFLHIYPNFVSEVNRLLRPEERMVLREGEKLNTDLRIMAFMRLGIEESARIAQMLNYSIYTIYTYRNKLKNRALSRDTFESDVMKIKSGV